MQIENTLIVPYSWLIYENRQKLIRRRKLHPLIRVISYSNTVSIKNRFAQLNDILLIIFIRTETSQNTVGHTSGVPQNGKRFKISAKISDVSDLFFESSFHVF